MILRSRTADRKIPDTTPWRTPIVPAASGLRFSPDHRWLDGALLVDLWDELDLPDPVRNVWLPAIAAAREGRLGVDTLNWRGQDPETAA